MHHILPRVVDLLIFLDICCRVWAASGISCYSNFSIVCFSMKVVQGAAAAALLSFTSETPALHRKLSRCGFFNLQDFFWCHHSRFPWKLATMLISPLLMPILAPIPPQCHRFGIGWSWSRRKGRAALFTHCSDVFHRFDDSGFDENPHGGVSTYSRDPASTAGPRWWPHPTLASDASRTASLRQTRTEHKNESASS